MISSLRFNSLSLPLLFTLTFWISTTELVAQKPHPSLEIVGFCIDKESQKKVALPVAGVKVELLENDSCIKTIPATNSNGLFLLWLPYDKSYKLRFSKVGYQTTWVDVSTHLEKGTPRYDDSMELKVPMFPDLPVEK